MNTEDESHKTEILIIRRHSGDDHAGHKGGAWKIAYADFVTAMMAFFLVMWLINSANEATRARVASYFNPIKMTDAAPAGKGLKDITNAKKSENKAAPESKSEKAGDDADTKGAGKTDTANAPEGKPTDEVLRDPYKTIEAIAQDGAVHPSGRTLEAVSEQAGDPFDPKAWEALREGKPTIDQPIADKGELVPAGGAAKAASPTAGKADQPIGKKPEQASGVDNSNPKNQDPAAAGGADVAKTANAEPATPVVDNSNPSVAVAPVVADKPATSAPSETANQQSDRATAELVSQTQKEINAAIARAGAQGDLNATVKMTSEGLLIVLSDATTHPMFALGQAKPTPALIQVIDTVGKILETQDGRVVVRGHTDARQFKNLNFDNWQLSTQRAHMASYILIHGGLDEARILKIEGYGSSDPIDATDPLADANRRVEILLRK